MPLRGSGIPNEKSSNITRAPPLDSLPPFCAKKIASVINISPMPAQNLKIDKFGGYKTESRGAVCEPMEKRAAFACGFPSMKLSPQRFLSMTNPVSRLRLSIW